MHALLLIFTGELPWVETVEVEEGDELDVEALALHLPAEVELDELLLRGVEPKPRHDEVVLVRVAAAVRRPGASSSSCRRGSHGAMPLLVPPAHDRPVVYYRSSLALSCLPRISMHRFLAFSLPS